MGAALRRLVPLAIVGGLLALVATAASMSTPGIHRSSLHPTPTSPRPAPSTTAPSANATQVNARNGTAGALTLPHWIQPLLIAIGAVAVLTLVALLIWRIISNIVDTRTARVARSTATTTTTTRHEAVLAAVNASITELARDDGDARSAVILCWVRLEEVAAAAGVARAPGDIPADLVRRLLAAHQVSGNVLDALADLYRAARYSPGDVALSMRDDARRAFVRLRDELSGSQRLGTQSSPDIRPRPRPSAPNRPGVDRS